ncbi:hypothetical protein PQX77_017328 [Marasmius sp. AFHP31]|nr:hypothetical protein PQX77_017328 [Marasmius sp. AFHP31]
MAICTLPGKPVLAQEKTGDMTFVDVQTPSGIIRYSYTISTPSCSNAEAISPGLPTILFFHPVYCIQATFHSQFSDPRLRRFNLVSVSLRGHIETTKPKVPPSYNPKDAADDAARFMDALNLPPCHMYGMASGTTIALQFAISYPERVLSLFLVSQLCLEEIPEVLEGQMEVYERWAAAFLDSSTVDMALAREATFGAIEYAYSNQPSSLAKALAEVTVSNTLIAWNREHLDVCKTMVVDFAGKRKPHSKSELSGINCPVTLVYGTNDIAYPAEYTERFVKNLEDAGVDVTLIRVTGAPHFVCIDYGHVINPIMHDLVVKLHSKSGSSSVPLPPIVDGAKSPWDTIIKEAGWEDKEEDFGDELIIEHKGV